MYIHLIYKYIKIDNISPDTSDPCLWNIQTIGENLAEQKVHFPQYDGLLKIAKFIPFTKVTV